MKIVLTWEWGAGWGHLRSFEPLVSHLINAGHDLTVVTRDLVRTQACFSSLPCIQAPLVAPARENIISRPETFADIVWNLGYDDAGKVNATLRGWMDVLRLLRPNLIISNFGLSSLVIGEAMRIPRLRVGTGYTCPPARLPLAGMTGNGIPANSRHREQQVMQWIQDSLRRVNLPTDLDWQDILGPDERTLLATVPELDPYRDARDDDAYLGFWNAGGGASPMWPRTGGCRTLAYLKPFPTLKHLLQSLDQLGVATALVGDGNLHQSISPSSSAKLRIQSGMVDLEQVRGVCPFAICNANHGTTSKLISLGIPVLAVPLYLEQRLTAAAIERSGWGLAVDPRRPEAFHHAIERLMHDSSIGNRVRAVAQRYQPWLSMALPRAIERMERSLC